MHKNSVNILIRQWTGF